MKIGKKVKVNIFKPLSSWEDFGENVDDASILGNANYLGSLYPTKAVVTEELNGNFYLEVEFLRDEASADLIKFENLIVVYGLPVLDKLPQAFRIKNYKVNRKKFSLTAKHRFYDTENYICKQQDLTRRSVSPSTDGANRIYDLAVMAVRWFARLERRPPDTMPTSWTYPTESVQNGSNVSWRRTSYLWSVIAKYYERESNKKGYPPYTTNDSAQYADLFTLLCLNPITDSPFHTKGPSRERYLAKFVEKVGGSIDNYVSQTTWENYYRSEANDGSWQGKVINGDFDGKVLTNIILEMAGLAKGYLFRSNEHYSVLEAAPQVDNIRLVVGRNIKSLDIEYNYDDFGNLIVDAGKASETFSPTVIEDTAFSSFNNQDFITPLYGENKWVAGDLGAIDIKHLADRPYVVTSPWGDHSENNWGVEEVNAWYLFPNYDEDPLFIKLRQAGELQSAQLIHEQPFRYNQNVKEEDYASASTYRTERRRECMAQLRAKMADCCEPKKIFTIDVVDDPRYRDGGKSLINSIYDQATVVDDVLGINETMQVYAYKWNVLLDRVESLTLGAIPKKLKDYI